MLSIDRCTILFCPDLTDAYTEAFPIIQLRNSYSYNEVTVTWLDEINELDNLSKNIVESVVEQCLQQIDPLEWLYKKIINMRSNFLIRIEE